MKQSILVITLLVFSTIGFLAQKTYSYFVYLDDGQAEINAIDSDLEKFRFKQKTTYYWYKNGEIHATESGSGGMLLQGIYTEKSKEGQLQAQGNFSKGLKHGVWKKWDKNGKLSERVMYRRGKKSGKYEHFDSLGNPDIEAKYRKGLLHGKSTTYQLNKTLSEKRYKKGQLIEPKPKKERKKLFEINKKDKEPENASPAEKSKRPKKTRKTKMKEKKPRDEKEKK